MRLAGLAVSLAVAAVFAGLWLAECAARSGAGQLPGPAGRVPGGRGARRLLARRAGAPGDPGRPRQPRPARSRPAAMGRVVLGISLLGLIDDALGRGSRATPRGWRGHARAVASGRFSTGAIKAVGALALAAVRDLGSGAAGLRLRRRPGVATSDDQSLQPARPAARARREGLHRAPRCGLHCRVDVAAHRAPWVSSSARSLVAPRSRCGSGRCSGTPAPTWSGPSGRRFW